MEYTPFATLWRSRQFSLLHFVSIEPQSRNTLISGLYQVLFGKLALLGNQFLHSPHQHQQATRQEIETNQQVDKPQGFETAMHSSSRLCSASLFRVVCHNTMFSKRK